MDRHTIRFTAQKVGQRLKLVEARAHRRRRAIGPLEWRPVASVDVPLEEAASGEAGWESVPALAYWGGPQQDFVMRGRFAAPKWMGTSGTVALHLPLGQSGDFSHPEALVYVDGQVVGAVDRHHPEIVLRPEHLDGAEHELLLHGWTGLLGGLTVGVGRKLHMGECAVVEIDTATREFAAAARTALQAATLLDEAVPAKARILNALDEAVLRLDLREPLGEAFYESVPPALATLRAGLAEAGPPLDVEVVAAGHAHIDVAWLWTLGQTRRKAQRTFTNVLRLMEQFPDYHFTQSQPQLYDYVRRDDPALFEGIKARVAEGRWEPLGGMWVEADCNLSGAEALARQFVLGRKFFREHFGEGAESPVLWLPDVFGYAWSLPQLIKLAGLEYFYTIKTGWNQYNKLPYESFWWQGLDGTRVLTHVSSGPELSESGTPDIRSTATYNANLTAFTALGAWLNLRHKEAQRRVLISYGWGDGGGGPTREMNEHARELRAFPGLPQVRQGRVIGFFEALEAESGAKLPVWNGELYLELHRGTYTTQARNKRANRKAEFLLHDTEFAAAYAGLVDKEYVYPRETMARAWELLCLNQFHDILPGSSIGAVYVESQEQYAMLRALAEPVLEEALGVVARHVGGEVVLVNPTSFERHDLVMWPGAVPEGKQIGGAFVQAVEGGTLIGGVVLGPYSATGLRFEERAGAAPDAEEYPLIAEVRRLENAYVRVELNEAGDVVRIFDKQSSREVLPAGAVANQFQAFEDRPLNWDAWDVDLFFDEKVYLAEPAESIRVVEAGPLRATIEIRRRILNSSYTQRLSLAYHSPCLDVETVMDWRERHVLLKVAFPVDILSPTARYEVQWGHVERPTHHNTSWDWARFETCGHKWVDLSEGGYGVALINDGKYGHDIRDNVIRLSLLRSPTEPDPEADLGEQRFAYRLYPHAGGGAEALGAVAREAYCFNDPVRVVGGGGGSGEALGTLIEASRNVIVETVKPAEDGRGIVVRFYEARRERGWVTLGFGFAVAEAWRTNLLEEDKERLEVGEAGVRVWVRPFEIVTVRVIPKS